MTRAHWLYSPPHHSNKGDLPPHSTVMPTFTQWQHGNPQHCGFQHLHSFDSSFKDELILDAKVEPNFKEHTSISSRWILLHMMDELMCKIFSIGYRILSISLSTRTFSRVSKLAWLHISYRLEGSLVRATIIYLKEG